MHAMRPITTLGFLSLCVIFSACAAMAQTPDPQSLQWIMLDGPPVIFEGPGRGPAPSASDEPLLAPKLQKELDQGKSALLSSKFEKASSDFQRAYQAAPGNPQVNFLLGVSFMALNNLRQADTYLGQAYSIYPRDPATLTAIGILRVKQSNFASAISSLKAAIGLNRKIYLPHLVLAGALLAENEFSESLQEARIALGQGKRQASEANFIVGEALARMGQNHAALKPLQEFVKDCPNDPAVTDARKLMGALVAKANVTAARTSP